MPHDPDAHAHNGIKAKLLVWSERPAPKPGRPPTMAGMERAIATAALYLGDVLEDICFEQWRQGTKREAARWFPEHMEDLPPH